MSDEGDKTCPLCAEEMDLTDQHLRPCKCGYEICVWCWHHIMDMAEKDETEGRCPACRIPYNKEKIVGTAASCERLVSEMNVEKNKSHKGKNKTPEGRKQLASVRVVQRNLVYVVGLPLDFADEDLLQRKEYFGQYGKVQKVSISRTATGAIQYFANSTCSVYITYSKEEEAVRCIQSVHGFVLDGSSLRACFGTTKYCHAWLRNMPCSNPECLYLHEVGSQEDSFTKDEVISSYTRSRVQQITGLSNSMQRRSGNALPPPTDEYCNNAASSGKPITKSAVNTNNSAINARVSPLRSSSGRSSALPAGASWGTRASSNQPSLGSTQCSNEPVKQKSNACNEPVECSTYAAGPNQFSLLHSDTGKMLVHGEECIFSKEKIKTENFEPQRKESDSDRRNDVPERSLGSAHFSILPLNRRATGQLATEFPHSSSNTVDSSLMPDGPAAAGPSHISSLQPDSGRVLALDEEATVSRGKSRIETSKPWKKESDTDRRTTASESSSGPEHSAALPLNRQAFDKPPTEPLPNSTNIVDSSLMPNDMASDKQSVDTSDGNTKNICSDILSMGIKENQILENGGGQHIREIVTSQLTGTTENMSTEVALGDVQPDLRLRMSTLVTQADLPEIQDNLLSSERRRIKDPEFAAIRKPEFSHASHLSKHSNICFSQNNNAESLISINLDTQVVDGIGNLINTMPNISNGCPQTILKVPEVHEAEYSTLVTTKEKSLLPGRYVGEVASGASDIGESSIISNILSMDFGSLDEPLTSPQNLAKLLGETDIRQGPPGVSGSLKIHNSNQSRFSFAREEDPICQGSNHINSDGYYEQGLKQHLLGDNSHISNRNSLQLEKLVSYKRFPVESDVFTGNHSHISLNRLSGSRSQVSAPPGFSVPSRAPPPGFDSHQRSEQNLDKVSGNHVLDVSSLLRNHYQALLSDNDITSNADIELIDPAILAVGKGVLPSGISSPGLDLRSSYSAQLSTHEEARFPSFLQRSLPQHLNQRYADLANCYSSLGDSYRIPSRVMEETLTNSLSQFSQFTHPQSRSGITSNGPWDGWNEIRSGNNLSMAAELLRTEKLGFNKPYGGYEDSRTRMPSSGNLYSGTYGI